MNKLISGYAGLYKQPVEDKFVSTLYCVTDNSKSKLIMILLSPSAFRDAYKISKNISYKEIYFIVPSMDIVFGSDLFNLYMKLRELKPYIKWVFPDKPEFPTSDEFEIGQIITDRFLYDDFYEYELNLSLEFILSNKSDKVFYDILLTTDTKTIYFSQFNTIDKLNNLYDNITFIDEFHTAYSTTIYGGLNYHEIISQSPKLYNKLVVHSFLNIGEYHYCKEMNRVKIGEVKYNAFI